MRVNVFMLAAIACSVALVAAKDTTMEKGAHLNTAAVEKKVAAAMEKKEGKAGNSLRMKANQKLKAEVRCIACSNGHRMFSVFPIP
jgi:hypothetical protein